MNIKTEYNPYTKEYSAYDYDNYEPGLPIGYGKTGQEAIEDFKGKTK